MTDAADLLEEYGKRAKEALNGPGEPEAALQQPLTQLLTGYGATLGLRTVLHEEVREDDGAVRPDYGLKVNGVMTGHVELKRPGTSLDPTTPGYGPTTHNGKQWRRLRNLPNLLHTNGATWRLWRYGELVGEEVNLHTSSLATHTGPLLAPPSFFTMLNDFLTWKPSPITSVNRLIDVLAPLAAMLREEVLEAVKADRRFAKAHNVDKNLRPFIGLKRDWRASLHPGATDEEFADGFAQTVVFSMVIALSEGTDLDGKSIPQIAEALEANHTLLGHSLELLTQHIGGSTVGLAIETIVRALSGAEWDRISAGRQDVYLHLYENFLSAYDPDLRKQSGSYYTPTEVVDGMTRLTDEALKKYLNVEQGLSSDDIAVIDPAMGTGTYPLSVLRHIARDAEPYGAGAVSDAISSAAHRIYGLELQSGPYSVAELRLTQAVRDMGGDIPEGGLNLYVADTLEDPSSGTDRQLSYTLQLIAEQRRQANRMKLETPIQVCIGNPPYKNNAQGMGGWVENGSSKSDHALLDDFRSSGGGRLEYVLKNLYVYFWRWAMWKVFESIPESTDGVVCFITATGYLNGPGFKGMREWIRRNTERGWIINLTPEGKQPPADTAVFNIETEVAIGLFIRNSENNSEQPADILYTELHGKRDDKFKKLSELSLDDDQFVAAGTDWHAGFVPAADKAWEAMPAMDDLFMWVSPGVKPNKTWVYAPSADILEQRWHDLLTESNIEKQRAKFKETRDTKIDRGHPPLHGEDVEKNTRTPISKTDWTTKPAIVRVAYRSLDRQYLIADNRLMDQSRTALWHARIPGQLFINEQHTRFPRRGPGLVFSALITDMNSFRGSEGGRAIPIYHPDGTPNVAPGLLTELSALLQQPVGVEDLAAYVAGVSAHPHYVETFAAELQNYANRVPITADIDMWDAAVAVGREVIWLHTYGERGEHRAGLSRVIDMTDGVELPEYGTSVGVDMPEGVSYDEDTQTISLGAGRWHNVRPEVWDYTIGGTNVIGSWVGYRRKKPKGRKSSPLDDINITNWTTALSREFSELLAVLTRLVMIEDEQRQLLDDVVAGELITLDMLVERGVRFPVSRADRKPRMHAEGQSPML